MDMLLLAKIFDFVVCLCTPRFSCVMLHPSLAGQFIFGGLARSLSRWQSLSERGAAEERAEGRKRGGLSFPILPIRRRLQVASTPDGKLVIILVNIII